MKTCIFCKATVKSANHVCPIKGKAIRNPLKNIAKPEIATENPFVKVSLNIEKPNISNIVYKVDTPKDYYEHKEIRLESKDDDDDINIDENAYILYDVMEFLTKNQDFCEGIFSHVCGNGCIQCTINSHIEGKNYKKAQRIYNEICQIYKKNIIMISFVNCLNIFLNCLHHLNIREFSDRTCNSECISHKTFFLNIIQELVCDCDEHKKSLLSLNGFTIPINIFNSTRASIREILFENSRITVPLCPSQKYCPRNNSLIITRILKANGWILFELKYESPDSFVDLSGFEDFFIDNLRTNYYLISLVFKDNLKYYNLFRCYLGWEFKEKDLILNSVNELNAFFNIKKLKPCLIAYGTKR
ncbi:hypothetical protein SteCoe_16038 [Stentor coeruleus]|uniref:Uncharacterized protein n=1 Tax=Stentor coeruleus TaxID=5963 RepID=A0A1R2C2A5_9CILI|nr:hypothetical protein SteCoe_16038 [Stentor coeruleus]